MKILYIHHCATPGGASRSLYNLLMHLPVAAIDMHIVTPKGSVSGLFRQLTDNVHEVSVHALPSFLPSAAGIRFLFPRSLFGYVKNRRALGEIRRIIDRVKPDLVHVNDTAIVPVAVLAARLGYPVVMHARTARAIQTGIFDRIVDRWIRKYQIKLVCISQSVRNSFPPDLPARIVYNPLFGENKVNPDATSARRHHADDPLNCLFLSNFLEYKGIFETIEAARILQDIPNVHFLIAGAAIRPRTYYRSLTGVVLDRLNLYPDIERRLQRTIEKYRLTNVTLLGHVEDIDAVIRMAHVNLAPVWLNAPPRSVFETGAQKVPTILALTNVVEDVVEHRRSGLIIPAKDARALAEAIMILRDDESLRRSMGERAHALCMERNDPVRAASEVYQIYESMLKMPRHAEV
ncbi:MAG: glycosyltransferase family 4 protein [Saprospiraceae bacterium]|nr:glycosyltransferase family 4 protein [Saprospiraceae bacterium]